MQKGKRQRANACPAQHYRSEDPKHYSAFQFSTIGSWPAFFVSCLILLAFRIDALAQDPRTEYYTEFSFAAGTPELPFWFYANSDARLRSGSTGNGFALIGFNHLFFDNESPFQVRTGGDLFARISDRQNTLHFQQLYIQADYGIFQLKAGNFYDPIGLNESDLSIGSMLVSRNSTPIPRIRFSTPEYVSIPGTNDFLQFKVRYSEGFLESDRVIPNPNLHQKYLYLRLNPIDRLSLYGGIVHNLVWGGSDEAGGRFFSSFSDYVRSILGIPREGGTTPAGNSIAAYDFAAKYNFNDFSIEASRLFYLEDLISARFRSPWDGVWGFQFNKTVKEGYLHSFHYQHINTKRQDSRGGQPPGRARYYWNVHYRSGWTYQGSVLGLPLITLDNDRNLNNNMLVGHHIGFGGNLNQHLTYNLFFTYSRNYGTCLDVQPEFEHFHQCLIPADANLDEMTIVPLNELREDQYSIMLQTSYRLPNIQNLNLQLKIAVDTGRLYRERMGIMAGIRWDGRL